MDLSAPVTTLPGIGPAVNSKLAKLEIFTIFDLLYHIPFRYEDRSKIYPIASLQPGETVTVIGILSHLKNEFTKNHKFIQTGVITDSTGKLPVIWFNQPYLIRTLKQANQVAMYGKVEIFNYKKTLVSPEYETINSQLIHMGRIIPIYPETRGLTSKWLRLKLFSILHTLPDQDPWPAPDNFPNWKESLINAHFPPISNWQLVISNCKSRLAFDELLLLHLNSLQRRQEWNKTQLSHPFTLDKTKVKNFISSLPFSLTNSQSLVVKDILSDLADVKPMNRLLEGDVGSGKTVIAAIAAYVAHLNSYQTLILAPTQILAHQHFQTLNSLFNTCNIKIGLATSNFKMQIANCNILVGTHALLSPKLKMEKVGLVVIDEQHRFGVAQRARAAHLGESPHILTMTATPIPRSIALTLHGDLDLSILSELPQGRIPTKTWIVPESKREQAYAWIKKQKTQIFIICPFIEPSETLSSVKAANEEFIKIKKIFPDFKVALLHGKMKINEKNDVMEKFRAGDYQILVCTPIVEVGIDIPQAHIMVIEDAQRYGLAQLHQLRGRIGRSSEQSYCLLFGATSTRLKAMETNNSGLELAELDLRLRGPGQIYGTVQHGTNDLKIASYTNVPLVNSVKSYAENLFNHLDKYPLLRNIIKKAKIYQVSPN